MEKDSSNTATLPAASPAASVARPQRDLRTKPKKLPPYNVVLLDDSLHTYDYVIEMLKAVFGFEELKGFTLAKEVDTKGRVIVFTTHRELAELKRDQIVAYGADVRMSSSKAGMNAVLEAAE